MERSLEEQFLAWLPSGLVIVGIVYIVCRYLTRTTLCRHTTVARYKGKVYCTNCLKCFGSSADWETKTNRQPPPWRPRPPSSKE